MLLRTVAVVFIIAGQFAVHACLGPENVFGIRFNNDESIDISVIENIGEEDINYYKNEQDGLLQYSFRSHYNSSIMVEIVISTDLGVLRFTIDTSAVSIADFPFEVCVRTELEWLVNAGIFEIERIKRERIEQAFQEETQKVYPAASYFWTKQDSLLPNNAIFKLTERGDFVVMQANCGGVAFAVSDLPPESLEIQYDVTVTHKKHVSQGRVAASSDRSTLRFDMHGRLYRWKPSGAASSGAVLLLMYDRSSGTVSKRLMLP